MQTASASVADGVQLNAVSNDKIYTPISMAKLATMKLSLEDQGKRSTCLCVENGERKNPGVSILAAAQQQSLPSQVLVFPRKTSTGARRFNSPTLHSPYARLSIARLAVVKADELGIFTPLSNAILRPMDSHPTII